jgi:hypothetical protein
MNEISPRSNLDWLAFQYVNQSLSESECEGFERLLLDSQECREAVARAVELALAAEFACHSSEVERVESATSRRAEDRGHRWMWAAVAASVAFLVGWQASLWYLDRGANHAAGPTVADSGFAEDQEQSLGGRELALAWEQMRQTFISADPESEGIVGPDFSDEAGDEPHAVLPDIETPSWMLAAVAGLEGSAAESASSQDDAPAVNARDEG